MRLCLWVVAQKERDKVHNIKDVHWLKKLKLKLAGGVRKLSQQNDEDIKLLEGLVEEQYNCCDYIVY